MANRHLARSVVLQSLFELDFYQLPGKKIDAIVKRNRDEFAPGSSEETEFIEKLVKGVLTHLKKINRVIEKAAPEWPIEQIALIDRNVLRIGLYELLFGNRTEVPPKVAINEAIELAKTYGSDSSGRFINGVLGTVYREIGEPGKHEKKKKKSDINPAALPVEELGGAVVYRRTPHGLLFALVHDAFGYWTLSKGHLEERENLREGTIREIQEELGIQHLTLEEELGSNEYIASDPEKGLVRRHVIYFLARTTEQTLTLGTSGGLDDTRWFTREDFEGLRIYDDIRPLLEKAIAIVERQKTAEHTEESQSSKQ